MNWRNIVQDLINAGWTQVQIADRCETTQATISDLSRHDTLPRSAHKGGREPMYGLGARLVALHAEVQKRESRRLVG